MKICLAQHSPVSGDIEKNIKDHLSLIDQAIQHSAQLILFSELSITGYEPELADKLAVDSNDIRFQSFQEKADKHQITIAIGAPELVGNEIRISLIIFQPNKERVTYSKQLLHEDELPFFSCGFEQKFVVRENEKIAFGICYETLQEEHIQHANRCDATLYLASVAKPQQGIEKAMKHFPTFSKKYQTPILMANCVGFYDNFLGVGQSAIWNENGKLVEHMDSDSIGFILYDSNLKTTEKVVINNTVQTVK